MERFLTRNSAARVINHPRGMYLADSKDRAFAAWREHDLPVPEYRVCNRVDDAFAFADACPQLLIRLNNGACGHGTEVLRKPDEKTLTSAYRRAERVAKKHRRRGRTDTRVVAVEMLDTSDRYGLVSQYRVFVVGSRVVGGYALVSDREMVNVATSVCASDREEAAFLEHNSELDHRLADGGFCAAMVEALGAVGLDLGCIDFVMIGGRAVLLEANALWTPCYAWVGGAAGEARFRRSPDEWRRMARGYCEWMDRAAFYQRVFDAFAQFGARA